MVRPPQSEGSQLVRNFVQLLLEFGLLWDVEVDTFTTTTIYPYNEQVTFHNIIATQDRNKPRLLTLACHYDSKRFPEGFIGATDSAVPCAIILHVALALDKLLKQQEDTDISLQVVMFDGEVNIYLSQVGKIADFHAVNVHQETLYNNTMFGPDGLYGSKSLAARWSEASFTSGPGPWCQAGEANLMDRIDLLLLLDLVGAPHPRFPSYLDSTTLECDHFAQELSRLEDVLVGASVSEEKFFTEECITENHNMDDHTPFIENGLRRALHVISDPFPEVWHTVEDNLENLDYDAVLRVNRIIRVFVAQYLNLGL